MGIYETFRKRYEQMMSGEPISFTEGETWDMMRHLGYFQIGMLKIRENAEKSGKIEKVFVCEVDEASVEAFLREKKREMRIV